MKKEEKITPMIPKELLLEIEKTFRRIWEKERKTDELFKKSVSLHEQIQTLITQELCKPAHEQNSETLALLSVRLRDTEEAIDTAASLVGELREIRDYFYGFMSEPQRKDEKS